MEEKSRCIVLRTVKLGDDKMIAELLCRECGRRSVLLPFGTGRKSNRQSTGSRNGGSRIRCNLIQPLNILEADLYSSPKLSLSRLADARLATVYTSIPFSGPKLSLAFFVAEFLTFSTRDLHNDQPLYDFVERSLIWLDTAERGIANFHLMFMMRMSRFLGFHPDLSDCHDGAFFDLREGCFCPAAPCHHDFLMPHDATHIATLMRMSPANLHLFITTREERNRITDICLRFYRLHIPAFGEMKTLEVLREL